nr:translation initiation factor IF-2-like [Aegilops tauschii subsp. strangulata]
MSLTRNPPVVAPRGLACHSPYRPQPPVRKRSRTPRSRRGLAPSPPHGPRPSPSARTCLPRRLPPPLPCCCAATAALLCCSPAMLLLLRCRPVQHCPDTRPRGPSLALPRRLSLPLVVQPAAPPAAERRAASSYPAPLLPHRPTPRWPPAPRRPRALSPGGLGGRPNGWLPCPATAWPRPPR